MTKRRIAGVGVAACLALAACLGVWYASRPHPVNEQNFARIQVGMTRAEVEVILGCPPGDYSTGESRYIYTAWTWTRRGSKWMMWISNDGEIRVRFDQQERVLESTFREWDGLQSPTLWDGLRAWLGW